MVRGGKQTNERSGFLLQGSFTDGRYNGLAHDPHGKLGLRTGQSQRRDVCM
jgi:hypothetical protein